MKKYFGLMVRALVLSGLVGAVMFVQKSPVLAFDPCPDIDVRVCWLDGGVYNYEFCKCEL